MQDVKNYDMRFTIVDPIGAVSFVGDGFFLPLLVAACSTDPPTLRDLLDTANKIDRRLRGHILRGLAIFDEHNVEGNYAAIHQALENGHEPVFRVVDEKTRQRSLEPTKTGLIIFNLKDRRIVQMLNHFYAVERSGEVHLHTGTRYSRRTVSYQLSEAWSIVP